MMQSKMLIYSMAITLLLQAGYSHAALVEFGSPMVYITNNTDPGVGSGWTQSSFDDSTWTAGAYGIGYDNASHAQNLLLTQTASGILSVYTRANFTITNKSTVSNLLFGVDYDDGFIAWINGVEVFRSPGMPTGTPVWNTRPSGHESSNGLVPDYTPLQDISATTIPVLQNGTNVLAIGVWNDSAFSGDLVLVPKLDIIEQAAPVVTRGAYLQSGTPTSIVIRWRTDVAANSRVSYGDAPNNLTMSVVDPGDTTEHSITLTGLIPDTKYYYAIGTNSTVLAGDDAQHYFITSPVHGTERPTRIWILGDSGTAGDPNHAGKAQAVADAYKTFTDGIHTDLWLMLGDNAYPNGTDSEYQVTVFDVYTDMLKKSVLWSAIGNHDGISANSSSQSGPYYDIFTLPTAAEAGGVPSGTEAYYSFDFGNIHFVSLDSSETDRSVDGEMLSWLELDLATTTQEWIIAFFHHPPYTKGSHDSDVQIQHIEMRENALPILEQAGVDLVLGGHSHDYERSYFIHGHYDTSDTFADSMKVDGGDGRTDGSGVYEAVDDSVNEGAVYIVAGSSGHASGGLLNHPAMFTSLNELGSVVLDIDGTRLDATFLDDKGNVRDYFTVIKPIDTCSHDEAPGLVDTDDDGINDICDTDDDNDGLEDTLEAIIGTDPLLADTDGDGLSDYEEVNYDGDPSQYTYGIDLNPLSIDTDMDGSPDSIDTLLWFILTIAASDSTDTDKTNAHYVCDGIDDQDQINEAINVLPPNGGEIALSEGSYKVRILAPHKKAILLKDNVILKGQNINTTHIRLVESQTLFSVVVHLDNVENVVVKDLQLNGDWISGNSPSAKGIGIREGRNNLIQNVHLKNFSEHFIAMSGAKDVLIDSIETSNIPGIDWPSHGVDIDERGSDSGIGARNITIQNSILANPGRDSTKVEHASNIYYINNIFLDRVVINNDTDDDEIGTGDIIYVNNTFSDQVRVAHRTGLVEFDSNVFDENGYINIIDDDEVVNIFNNEFNGTSDYFGLPQWINASNNTGVEAHDTRFVSASPTGPRWGERPPPDITVSIRFLTPETAAPDIQSAIDSASIGDVIMIADGTYSGSGNFSISTLGKAVTIRSENGPESTIIDATDIANAHIFNIVDNETSSTVLDGLTLTGGNRDYDGGAIKVSGASPVLANLVIKNNTAAIGGAIRITNAASPTIINTRFINNSASESGGAISIDNASTPTITYSIFSGNSASLGGAIHSTDNSTVTINNTTIFGNSALLDGGALRLEENSSLIMNNSILWNYGTEINTVGSSSADVNYSDIKGGYPGTTNKNTDPLFIAPLENDFSLQLTSSLIDAGIDLNYTTDHVGNTIYDVPFILDSGNTGSYNRTYVDIGAMEVGICTANPSHGPDNDDDGIGDVCDADDDNDGLEDVIEAAIGTNPLLIDTDGDTLSDYEEVAYDGIPDIYTPESDLNPLSTDTDNDQFTDNIDPIPLIFNFNDGDLAPLGFPDGFINTADYLIMQRFVLDEITPSDLDLSHGDLYPSDAPDGVINIQDLILHRQLLE